MKKVKSDISKKIIITDTVFTKINSKAINSAILKQLNENESVNLVNVVNYEVLENLEDKLKLRYNINVGFEPKVFFEADIDVEIECILKESLDEDLTEADANIILEEISPSLSLVIAFLTERLAKKPLILPPAFKIGKE